MKVTFAEDALQEYIYWQMQDKKTLKKINQLIQDIQRNGLMSGIGKPEPLKNQKAFSRRIDDKNRLVYIGDENQNLIILSFFSINFLIFSVSIMIKSGFRPIKRIFLSSFPIKL